MGPELNDSLSYLDMSKSKGKYFFWEQIIIFKDTKRLLSDRQGLEGREELTGHTLRRQKVNLYLSEHNFLLPTNLTI